MSVVVQCAFNCSDSLCIVIVFFIKCYHAAMSVYIIEMCNPNKVVEKNVLMIYKK